MKATVLYKSLTGNTRLLADTLAKELDCSVQPITTQDIEVSTEIVCIGFWTDKGVCDKDVQRVLKSLHHKKVFLFGTAGFGKQEDYFQAILKRVSNYLDESNVVIGGFMCQGKMPLAVKQKYERMLEEHPDNEHFKGMIENFDEALSHPNTQDLKDLQEYVQKVIV